VDLTFQFKKKRTMAGLP